MMQITEISSLNFYQLDIFLHPMKMPAHMTMQIVCVLSERLSKGL